MIRTLPLLLACALAACQQSDPEAQARAAREQAAQAEAKAAEAAKAFEASYARGEFALARAQGDVLLAEHPDSAAAGRIKERHADAGAKAQAERETRRLSGMWAYQSQPVKQGTQLSAGIYSRDTVKTGSGRADRVRLIFRDHPDWGRSAYLVLQDGDFDCYGGCRVDVAVDEAKSVRMAASRPDTDEAIAMFIEDEFALWPKAEASTKSLAITFPVKAGGTRTAVFETGELDAAKLPKWPQP